MTSNCVPHQVRMHASWPWSSRPPSWQENSPSFPPSRLGISLRPTWPSTESDDVRHGARLVLGMALGTALDTALDTALERPDAGYVVGSLDEGALRTVLSSAPLDGRGSMACGLEPRRRRARTGHRARIPNAANVRYCTRVIFIIVVPPCLDGTGISYRVFLSFVFVRSR